MVKKTFECYIGGVDLSPYIRAIDFEEDSPEMMRFWNAHSRVFFRRNFIRATNNTLLELAPFFTSKEPSVYLAVNGVFMTYSKARIRTRDGKSLEISKVSSASINLAGLEDAIRRMGENIAPIGAVFQGIYRAMGVPQRLIMPRRNDRGDVADAAEIAWHGGVDWGIPNRENVARFNADIGHVIARYEAEDIASRHIDFTGRLQEDIDETLLRGDRDENE